MARPTAWEDEVELAGVHEGLVAASLLEPVALGGADERICADCDLASLAENRLGVAVDPRSLSTAERQDLLTRATVEPCSLPSQRRFEACFWLLEAGERVGSVARSGRTLAVARSIASPITWAPLLDLASAPHGAERASARLSAP